MRLNTALFFKQNCFISKPLKKRTNFKKQNKKKNLNLIPKASCRYFWPTSLRYSSMALVARVFSRNIRCSLSPHRSTSDIIRSVRKSCITHKDKQKEKDIIKKSWFNFFFSNGIVIFQHEWTTHLGCLAPSEADY